MTKYQKTFIVISLVFTLPSVILLFQSIFGHGRLSITFFYALIPLLIHWLFYYINFKIAHKPIWIIYIPSIFLLIVTLFFLSIYLINLGHTCDLGVDGCMNEDFSIVFLYISSVITILSFGYSILFSCLWYKKIK